MDVAMEISENIQGKYYYIFSLVFKKSAAHSRLCVTISRSKHLVEHQQNELLISICTRSFESNETFIKMTKFIQKYREGNGIM